MKIWKVILATLVIFAAGLMTGSVVSRLQKCHWWSPVLVQEARDEVTMVNGTNREPGQAGGLGRIPFRTVRKDFLQRLDRELKLDPEQRERIEKILEESQQHTREILKKVEPEMRAEKDKTHGLIRETLTPEQAALFETLLKRPGKPPKEASTTNGAASVSTEPSSAPVPPEDKAPQL